MIIFLPTFVQKKTLTIPSLPLTRNSKSPPSIDFVCGKPRLEPNSIIKSVSLNKFVTFRQEKHVIFFSRSEDYILSARQSSAALYADNLAALSARQSSAALYADNSADKMSVSVRVGPWQKNRYHQKILRSFR